MFGGALLAIGDRAADLIVERYYVAHAFLDLGLSQTVTGHSDKLIGPELLEVADFTSGHDDGTGYT